MNRILEYIIRAKDYTREAVETAKARVRDFAAKVKSSLADTEKRAKAATAQIGNDASSAVNPMELIFNALHGNIEGTIKAMARLGGEMDGFREVLARMSSVIVDEVGGAINTALKGIVSGAGKAAAAMKSLGVSISSVSGVAIVLAGLVKWFGFLAGKVREARDRVKEMAEAARQTGMELFARRIEETAKAQERLADATARANAEYERQRAHASAIGGADADRRVAELEAARQAELDAISVADADGRNAVNARYDDLVRGVRDARAGEAARESGAAIGKQISELEDASAELRRELGKTRKDLDAELQGINSGILSGDDLRDSEARAEKLRQAKASQERQLRDYNRQIAGLQARQGELAAGEEARVASVAAEEARIRRERRDAEEEAANAAWEAYEAEMEAYEAERERMEEEAANEERRRIEEEFRMREEMERRLHDERVGNIRDEMAAQDQLRSEAEGRLAAAKSQVAKAWGWYRNKDSMQAEIDNYNEQKEAEAQFEKDFARLRAKASGRFDWRTIEIGKLSAEDEAVRQVALAKEAEEQASKDLAEIAENTRGLSDKLDELLSMKEGA